MTEPEGV